KSYYTFSDFFIQTDDEVPPTGINIRYQILHNNWRGHEPGLGWQTRKKREGGRWNNYERRVNRNVVYFGIQRVVPHNERSACISYRRYFLPGDIDNVKKQRIKDIAGRIFGKGYDDFDFLEHSKYRLPVVNASGVIYSGFNMGAGENAVFSILLTLFEAGKGALLVIDEIELGLHKKAQKQFIEELKNLCQEFHCQIICSTHSSVILDTLPSEARFFVESGSGYTKITPGISSEYASGKLAGANSRELDIFVEDGVGKLIFSEILPLNIRERIKVIPIGSSEAVVRQLAARHRESRDNCIAFLDGDQRNKINRLKTKIKTYLENRYNCSEEEMDAWIDKRLHFLPGETWPEKWCIETASDQTDVSELAIMWGTDKVKIQELISVAAQAGKHNEFYSLHNNLHKPEERLQSDVMRYIKNQCPDLFQDVIAATNTLLDEIG
ncbi:MAG: AAA family ATPase, partial [Thermodesulfobacteriota bacterium]|nr:AAA family ATPase [Thermodesulfobacteriota bacterium]